jgi:hypothetical protein
MDSTRKRRGKFKSAKLLLPWGSTAKNEGRISSNKGPQKRPSAKTTEELAAEFATLTLSPEEENLLQHLRTKWQEYHAIR